ncbi:hypothetical protein EI171_20985 [Bradyrhizobium sp. LCT2]|uniref:hypothetical protein n=1 Tax=Bradyrhizobium sp. LCT2 TaxID=2493093 RepID=UPI0013738357|nr:hypothetical protein [Bradyrhizobium sp. LCT2]QHP69544.1 hypothetical protein EI171_20985 [Bradyrhizobium sp. LCT2]
MMGIAVGALQLKPTSFSIIGATFSLDRPELIEGLLFVGCLLYYVATFYFITFAPFSSRSLSMHRKAIWFGASRNGKTLKGISKYQRLRIRLDARTAFRLSFWTAVAGAVLPLAHILIYRREPLWNALRLIFASEL